MVADILWRVLHLCPVSVTDARQVRMVTDSQTFPLLTNDKMFGLRDNVADQTTGALDDSWKVHVCELFCE